MMPACLRVVRILTACAPAVLSVGCPERTFDLCEGGEPCHPLVALARVAPPCSDDEVTVAPTIFPAYDASTSSDPITGTLTSADFQVRQWCVRDGVLRQGFGTAFTVPLGRDLEFPFGIPEAYVSGSARSSRSQMSAAFRGPLAGVWCVTLGYYLQEPAAPTARLVVRRNFGTVVLPGSEGLGMRGENTTIQTLSRLL